MTLSLKNYYNSSPAATLTTSTFVATAAQTTFSVAYTPGLIGVFINGVKLSASAYTATNGTSVVLGVGASLNAQIDIQVFGAYNIANINGMLATATPLQNSGIGAVGTSGKAAKEDHTHPVDTSNNFTFRNRIINGDMRIDQRNNGAEISPAVSTNYYLDRWTIGATQTGKFKIGRNAGGVTPPPGFANYLGCTSLSAFTTGSSDYFIVYQLIEGFNAVDFAWGTASAKAVTLSFKVYSSLTGNFGGALRLPVVGRSYPFSYSVPVANTWTTVSITIPGDTLGVWLTGNDAGIFVGFSLGTGDTLSGASGAWSATSYFSPPSAVSIVGTNAATWYVTGVQLERGTTATAFEQRPISVEQTLCQRYLPPLLNGAGVVISSTVGYVSSTFMVPARVAPTGVVATTLGLCIFNAGSSPIISWGFSTPSTVTGSICTISFSSSYGAVALAGVATFAMAGYFTGCEL
jgi:hypothetical protein